MPHILVVEDDGAIADAVVYALRKDGMVADAEGTLAGARTRLSGVELVVLDLTLPDGSGFSLLSELRRAPEPPRVIVLTSRDEDIDCVAALEAGADDFVTKPFSPRALVARVRAVLRRGAPASLPPGSATDGASGSPQASAQGAHGQAPSGAQAGTPAGGLRSMSPGAQAAAGFSGAAHGGAAAAALSGAGGSLGLLVDVERRLATFEGREIPLTKIEFDLLATLAESPGRVRTRGQLVERVWGPSYALTERTVDSHFKGLRRKLEEVGAPSTLIETVRGVGFKLREEP